MPEDIRILVAEDSGLVRDMLVSMLESDPNLRVIGWARTGVKAVEKTLKLKPDLITMDVMMPKMDGLEAIQEIMRRRPTPILVVTSSMVKQARNVPFTAIEAGALSVLEKPDGRADAETLKGFSSKLVREVKVLAGLKVLPRTRRERREPPSSQVVPRARPPGVKLIAIGVSTGGPKVLQEIVSGLPAFFPVPIVVVQHMDKGFVEGLVDWLRGSTALALKLAASGDRVRPGTVFFAPGGRHMVVNETGTLRLHDGPPVHFCRPSVDVLFESVARSYRSNAMAVILTGMGQDGAEGMLAVRNEGGRTIAQDEKSCVVFGMPKVAIEVGGVEKVLSPSGILRAITGMHVPKAV